MKKLIAIALCIGAILALVYAISGGRKNKDEIVVEDEDIFE